MFGPNWWARHTHKLISLIRDPLPGAMRQVDQQRPRLMQTARHYILPSNPQAFVLDGVEAVRNRESGGLDAPGGVPPFRQVNPGVTSGGGSHPFVGRNKGILLGGAHPAPNLLNQQSGAQQAAASVAPPSDLFADPCQACQGSRGGTGAGSGAGAGGAGSGAGAGGAGSGAGTGGAGSGAGTGGAGSGAGTGGGGGGGTVDVGPNIDPVTGIRGGGGYSWCPCRDAAGNCTNCPQGRGAV